jgi:hypothetical protein
VSEVSAGLEIARAIAVIVAILGAIAWIESLYSQIRQARRELHWSRDEVARLKAEIRSWQIGAELTVKEFGLIAVVQPEAHTYKPSPDKAKK